MEYISAYLLSKQQVAAETLECVFQVTIPYTFEPGQYAYVTLPNSGETRLLSFVNAPTSLNQVCFVVRLRPSIFKQELQSLSQGSKIFMSPPLGYFSLPSDPSIPVVLVAGGIGIAPFLSMLESKKYFGLHRTISLLTTTTHTNRMVYCDRIQLLRSQYPNMKVHHFITREKEKGEPLEDYVYGRITSETLKDLSSSDPKLEYYLAGTSVLVTSLAESLQREGIIPSRIKMEAFTGYE